MVAWDISTTLRSRMKSIKLQWVFYRFVTRRVCLQPCMSILTEASGSANCCRSRGVKQGRRELLWIVLPTNLRSIWSATSLFLALRCVAWSRAKWFKLQWLVHSTVAGRICLQTCIPILHRSELVPRTFAGRTKSSEGHSNCNEQFIELLQVAFVYKLACRLSL